MSEFTFNSINPKYPMDFNQWVGMCDGRITPPSTRRNRVNFNNNVDVKLIPTRQEFASHGLLSELWWNSDEYMHIKYHVANEVRELMKEGMTTKEAIRVVLHATDRVTTSINDNNEEIVIPV